MTDTQNLLDDLRKTRLIAVVAIPDPELSVPLAEALLKGGVNWIEITFRNDFASESLNKLQESKIFNKMYVGAGTVRTIEQAKKAIEAGVKFIVSPGFSVKVLKYVEYNSEIPFFPGVDSTIGIELACDLGLRILKFFPAGVSGGVKWLKAVKGPYFDISFIPTGGVNLETLRGFLELPNVIGCGGSFLAPRKLIIEKNWDKITEICEKAMKIVRSIE
ncbi:MAG: bifunctional 4-hydroxy-2-oxoglutarate aldolase/2-dehydro-3-deoxy-phosphogluconate aldolase [archaeon]|nr:bifunctional 4-hydroxy-2-oxoglutarate aldolase/2-dehydro-3-deoxy-phosphogluconate aldolase [archaeon]